MRLKYSNLRDFFLSAIRLKHILDVFTILNTYSTLSLSNIEGLEQLNSRFQLAANTIMKKPYDVLEYRKKEFAEDYDEFKRQVKDVQVCFFYFTLIKYRAFLHKLVTLNCILT